MAQGLRVDWRWVAVVLVVMLLVVVGSQAQGTGTPPAEDGGAGNPNPALPAGAEPQAGVVGSAGPYYKTLPPAAFTSDGNYPNGYRHDLNSRYFYGVVDDACLMAPVDLPAGTKVTSLEVTVNDARADNYEWFQLWRVNLSSGVSEIMAYVTTPIGMTAGVVMLGDYTVVYPEVSADYAYQVVTCAEKDIYVSGARVGYSAATYLPAVLK